jgi:hypothetical protein
MKAYYYLEAESFRSQKSHIRNFKHPKWLSYGSIKGFGVLNVASGVLFKRRYLSHERHIPTNSGASNGITVAGEDVLVQG